jgi:hypothetical protein
MTPGASASTTTHRENPTMTLAQITRATAIFDGDGWTVEACDKDGRIFCRCNPDASPLHMSKAIASGLAAKVKERGNINLAYWSCHVPYGSAAWLLDGCEQRQIEDERDGYL